MKKLGDILFSPKLMALVLALFALSIAVATFIENDFGSNTARALVYNARWFEILLLVGMVNLAGTIIVKKLYRKSSLTIFIFHLSFICILLGAAITRYIGFEGSMTLKEGETSGKILTDQAYITIRHNEQEQVIPAVFTAVGRNRMHKTLNLDGTSMGIKVNKFITNAVPDIQPDPEGKPMAVLVYNSPSGRISIPVASGETAQAGPLAFSFDQAEADSGSVKLVSGGDSLVFIAPMQVVKTSMSDQSQELLEAGKPYRLMPLQLYTFGGTMVVMSQYLPTAKKTARELTGKAQGETYDALVLQLSSGSATKEVTLWGKAGYPGDPAMVTINNESFAISYGSVYKAIPFQLKLNDFMVERYPGSKSPSWFESKVTLLDASKKLQEDRRIYMNNILKYKGYRFYQSSYTSDEQGTILSVNHDWAGTLVTYFGYLLMGLGMALSLANRSSRFRRLSVENALLKNARKSLVMIAMLLGLSAGLLGQATPGAGFNATVNAAHAEKFGKMLVQDNDGRIEPMNTLCADVLRKISRKSEFNGLKPEQVIIGMMADPAGWQNQPMIRASHPGIMELMGDHSKYHSFASFFRNNSYILSSYVEQAYQKKPAERSKFDNEIIRLDERVNISYMVFTGDLFRILPDPEDQSRTWYDHSGIQGRVHTGDSVFLNHVVPLYVQEVQASMQSGDWSGPDKLVDALTIYQRNTASDIVPSEGKVRMEIFFNRSGVFPRIAAVYGIVGFVLLILQFVGLFYTRLKINTPEKIALWLILLAFVLHTAGLALRWYISGHAPWSNGYEALTYIAWATVLAGLIFSSRASITLSTTAILAYLILETAHMSWMDPQITNLVPVLKSYWLVIHVATITASYGFLALGAILAAVNLFLMILVSKKSIAYIDLTIKEISNIIEMTLIVGLYMLTVGTFLGGVWANESWGRYWGWDPKETWALVTVLIYAFIVHMRMVPGLKGTYAFNLAALTGFSAVIMTYFGVNYYLSGLHSYAKGDPLPVPVFVYYTLIVLAAVALTAYINYRKLSKEAMQV
jgi:cytochrome c-type biogenesis protein CcsB